MQSTPCVFTKAGDVRGEVQQIVEEALGNAGLPIEDGLHDLLVPAEDAGYCGSVRRTRGLS